MIKPPSIDSVDYRHDMEYVTAIKEYCRVHKIPYYSGIESFIEVIYNHTGEAISRYYHNNPMYISECYNDYFGYDVQERYDPIKGIDDCDFIDNFELFINVDVPEGIDLPSWYYKAQRELKTHSYFDLKKTCIKYYKEDVLQDISIKLEGKSYYLASLDRKYLKIILSNSNLFSKITSISNKTISKLFDATASHSYVSSAIEQLYANNASENKRTYLLNELNLVQLFFDLYDKSKDKKAEPTSFINTMFSFIEVWSLAKDFLYSANSWATNPDELIKKFCRYYSSIKDKVAKKDQEVETKINAIRRLFYTPYQQGAIYENNYDALKFLFVNNEHYHQSVKKVKESIRYWHKLKNETKIVINNKEYTNCYKDIFKKEFKYIKDHTIKSPFEKI